MNIEPKSQSQTMPTENRMISQNPLDKITKSGITQKLQPMLIFIKDFVSKFYNNKKVFIPILIAAVLILATLIIGIAFGSKKSKPINNENKPTEPPYKTPIVQNQATSSSSVFENKLKNIGSDIEKLDVKQSKIKPPEFHFDINF